MVMLEDTLKSISMGYDKGTITIKGLVSLDELAIHKGYPTFTEMTNQTDITISSANHVLDEIIQIIEYEINSSTIQENYVSNVKNIIVEMFNRKMETVSGYTSYMPHELLYNKEREMLNAASALLEREDKKFEPKIAWAGKMAEPEPSAIQQHGALSLSGNEKDRCSTPEDIKCEVSQVKEEIKEVDIIDQLEIEFEKWSKGEVKK